MKKRTERRPAETPVDALFARRLSDTSLTPTAGSFERLQARLGRQASTRPMVVWRTLAAQRYAAIAAGLVLIATFGWLYRSGAGRQPVAVVRSEKASVLTQARTESKNYTALPANAEERPLTTNETLAVRTTDVNRTPADNRVKQPAAGNNRRTEQADNAPANWARPADSGNQSGSPASGQLSEERVAETPAKQSPTERVLIVTIAEPEALVAARQAAQQLETNQMEALAKTQREKKTKAAAVWQRVKRFKSGEIMARRTGADDERNLLNRAYNGLRQTLEKDKPSKQ